MCRWLDGGGGWKVKFRGYGNVVVDAVPFPFSTLIIGNRPANFRRYVNCALFLSIPISREREAG